MGFFEIGKDIWLNEIRLDGFDVRGVLAVGTDRALIFDTLSHPDDMRPYLPHIAGKQVLAVYSHADWDHIWGTAGLPLNRSLIIGHAACRERFLSDVPETLREKRKNKPNLWDAVRLIPPAILFREELVLDLGSFTVHLHHLEGHTPDCIVAFIPEKGLLLAGDAVETPFPCLDRESPVRAWMERLRHWKQVPGLKTVIPAHGTMGGHEVIQQNIEYLKGLLDGNPVAPPDGLSEFYSSAHQDNIRAAAATEG